VETSVSFYTLEKQFALTISRGTVAKNENLWLRIEAEGVEGWGEVSGFSTGNVTQLTRDLYTLINSLRRLYKPIALGNIKPSEPI